jgi:hypothetical protein
MPLHRDIYWVGRQWAVTGYGMQAIDQRLNGIFDIEISRLWEESLAERMHALDWLNAADFDKGLAAARKRYPDPDRQAARSDESVSRLKEESVSWPDPQSAVTAWSSRKRKPGFERQCQHYRSVRSPSLIKFFEVSDIDQA